MSEISPSSLDARELLSRPIDQFHAKSYEIGGDFQMLWGIVDIYLQRLDPVTRGLVDPGVIPLEKHSSLYRDTRQKLYLEIVRTPGFDIAQIQTINISPAGILSIHYPSRVENINLITRWNNMLLPAPEKGGILQRSEKARTNLEKEVSTESLYDGSVLVSYIPGTVLTLAGAHALYDGGKKGTEGVKFVIDKVTIRDSDGKMQIIKLSEAYSGSRNVIKGSIMKLLEKAGYMWDAVSKGWFSPIERSLGATKKELKSLTYEEYRKTKPEKILSESDFNKLKQEVLTTLEKASNTTWSNRISYITKTLSRNAGELFFFPIFFRHFQSYQNSATFIAGIAELGAFTVGARLGARYIPLPGVFRVLSPLVGGGGGILLSHMGAEAIDINRKKWNHFSTNGFGSLYTKGKSTAGHFTLGLAIQEGVDVINKAGQKMVDLTRIPSDDLDIGIPRLEIPLPGGRYLGTIPEVNMFQSTVSFGTAPGEWVRGARGRNIDEWNRKVFLYEEVISRKIQDLLGKYQSGSSMFASKGKIKEAGSKEKLLEIHLREIILGGGESDTFAGEGSSLVRELVTYISQDPKVIRKKTVEDIIKNRVSQMYVDEHFIEKRNALSKYKQTSLLPDLARQLSVRSDILRYLISLPERMSGERPLYSDLIEKKLYGTLLENKSVIHIDFPYFSGQTTVGNAFAMYLEEVLKYSREGEFLSEIQKGNKKGVQWTL